MTVTSPVGGFANPWQDYPSGDPFPLVIDKNAKFQPGGSYPTYPFDVHAPYSEQWNISIRKQLGSDWLVSANYVGSNTIYMWTGRDANPVIDLPGSSCVIAGRTFTPCSSTANSVQRTSLYLQNPDQGQYYTGGISELDDGGTASYNSLQLSVQRRSSNGLTVQGNYTYSHCISDLLNQQLGTNGENYQIPGNRRFDRGNCAMQDVCAELWAHHVGRRPANLATCTEICFLGDQNAIWLLHA